MKVVLDVRLAPEAGTPTCGSQCDNGDDGDKGEEDHCRDNAVTEHSPGGATALIRSRAYTPTKQRHL